MNISFTIFDPLTGAIDHSGSVSPETFEYYATSGAHAILNVEADNRTHYVRLSDLEIIAYTGEELEAKNGMAPGWVWQMPERVAIDARTLVDLIARTVVEVDRVADLSRAAVVGDPVRIKEYERAQQHAEQFRDVGFTGTAPPSVACWAAAKEWTPQQAAEDILAASARWLGALDGIRALRLQAKEDIRRATTNAQVDTLLVTFIATLTAAMQGVQ